MKKLILLGIIAAAIAACTNVPVVGETVSTDSIDSVEVVDTIVTDTVVVDSIID